MTNKKCQRWSASIKAVLAKRERLLYLPFARKGKRGNRTRPSGAFKPFLSLAVPCADGHGLEISHTGILCPRCRYAVYANDRYSLLG